MNAKQWSELEPHVKAKIGRPLYELSHTRQPLPPGAEPFGAYYSRPVAEVTDAGGLAFYHATLGPDEVLKFKAWVKEMWPDGA